MNKDATRRREKRKNNPTSKIKTRYNKRRIMNSAHDSKRTTRNEPETARETLVDRCDVMWCVYERMNK